MKAWRPDKKVVTVPARDEGGWEEPGWQGRKVLRNGLDSGSISKRAGFGSKTATWRARKEIQGQD